jgi:hypothetical protein
MNKTWFLKNLSILFVTMYWLVDNDEYQRAVERERKDSNGKN